MADVEQHAAFARFETARRTPPSAVVGLLGKGRKQWVRTSPGRNRARTSSSVGGGMSMCTMSGTLVSSAALSRCRGAACPNFRRVEADPHFYADIVSGFARTTSTVSIGAISLRSPLSPTMTRFEKP